MPTDDALTADEVAKILRVSRNTVYNLVKRDELASYYVGRKMRFSRADVENYILRSTSTPAASMRPASGLGVEPLGRADASEGSVASRPASSSGVRSSRESAYVIAGNDIVGDMLANYLGAAARLSFERVYVGSHAALVDMYAGRAHAALVHLLDSSGDYNVSFMEGMLPGMGVRLVRLVRRRQGLIVAKGNPKELRSWGDLGREGVRMVNRERGCGSRVLLDKKLSECGIDRLSLSGYDRECGSALAAASFVARGAADVCVGSERAFHQVEGVDFLPLQDEWLDMALSLESPVCVRIADAACRLVRSRPFKEDVARLVGYDVSRMGQIVFERA